MNNKRDLLLGAAFTAVLLVLAFTAPTALGWLGAAVAVGLLFGAAWMSPVFGVAVLVVVTAFQTFIDFYLPHSGSIWAGAIIRDALLITIFVRWLAGRYLLVARRAPLSRTEKLAIAYVVLLAFWIPSAPVLAGAVTEYRNLAAFMVLLLVAADRQFPTAHRWILVEVFFVTALISGMIGIAESVTNRAIFSAIGYDVQQVLGGALPWDIAFRNQLFPRATGGTGNPLDYGFYMAFAATMALGCISAHAPIRRGLSVLVAVVASAAAVLAFARSAMACLIIGIVGLALILRLRRAWLWTVLLALALVGAMFTPAGKAVSARFTFQDQAGFTTAQSRLEIFERVLGSGVTVTGSGLGTQGAGLSRSVQVTNYIVTDNYYGSILLQVGFVPLAVFVTFIAMLTLGFYRLYRSALSHDTKVLAAVGLVLTLMLVVEAFVSSSLESRAVSTEVWTLLGLILGEARLRRTGRVADRPPRTIPLRRAAVSA
jgi:hypothetical protein